MAKYYWEAHVIGTGKMTQDNKPHPTVNDAVECAARVLAKRRDGPDEVYRVEVYDRVPPVEAREKEGAIEVYNRLVRRDQLPGYKAHGSEWVCPSCHTPNYEPGTDPRKVQCHKCKESYTVTGRHVTGDLIVQHFAVR